MQFNPEKNRYELTDEDVALLGAPKMENFVPLAQTDYLMKRVGAAIEQVAGATVSQSSVPANRMRLFNVIPQHTEQLVGMVGCLRGQLQPAAETLLQER